MGLIDQYALAHDATFRKRVEIAAVKMSKAGQGETQGGMTLVQWQRRADFFRQILSMHSFEAGEPSWIDMVAAVVAANATIGAIVPNITYAITGITNANPGVVSSSVLPDNGQVVLVKGNTGMTQVNDRLFVVANAAGGSFELQGEDTSGYGAWTAGGTWERRATDGDLEFAFTEAIDDMAGVSGEDLGL